MTQFSEYGVKCISAMKAKGITQKELADMVSERSKMFCDSPYLNRIFTGQRNPERIVAVINEILSLEQ